MTEDKTNPKYLDNASLHYNDLVKFRDRLKAKILGESNKEVRDDLNFLIGRTEDKLAEVQAKLVQS